MTTDAGNLITASDVNGLIDSIESVYAQGVGDYGYGQSLYTIADVTVGKKITAQDWSKIRGMLLVCSNHQGTANSTLFPDPTVGKHVMSTTSAIAIASACKQNRLTAGTGSMADFDDLATGAYTTGWNGVLEAKADISFPSEDAARFFFNSGGLVEINLTHNAGSTAQDVSFRNFLARQIGTLFIGAHTSQIGGTDNATSLANSGYYEFPATETTIATEVSTSFLSTTADQVSVSVQRTGFAGVRGANGTGFQVTLQATFMGDASGSFLSAGTAIDVDIVEASTYLSVASPNCAVSGLRLIQAGNVGPSTPGGGVHTVDPFDPAPGTVQYIVPEYATIMFELKGGGGSQGSSTGPYPRSDGATIYLARGTDGEDATCAALGLVAKGGQGGAYYDLTNNAAGANGADGVGTGGDVNTTGGGALGGSGRYAGLTNYFNGSAGGAGAYVRKTYVRGQAGAPSPGDVLTLTIPIGGSQTNLPIPSDVPTVFFPGADGARGQVKVTVTNTSTGSVSYNAPGTYQFKIPTYSSITFDLSGAGGGQGHDIDEFGIGYLYQGNVVTDMLFNIAVPDGGAGGGTSIPELNIAATGGGGGTYAPYVVPGGYITFTRVATAIGAAGVGIGGQQNIQGGGATGGAIYYGYNPPPTSYIDANDPTKPYYAQFLNYYEGARGGAGGRAVATFTTTDKGAPVAGTVVTVNVGAGGGPAPIDPRQATYGHVYGTGGNGSATINWTGTTTSVDNPA